MSMSHFTTLDEIAELFGTAAESQFLEFKHGAALDTIDQSSTKDEIVRDINAFANAGGGTILYGIEEDKKRSPSVASGIAPVTNPKADDLRLTNIIRNGMEPVFNGFSIRQMSVVEGRIIVVEIAKGNTAHQCKSDHKYYHRVGPSRAPMYDHEIRDVMNRRTSAIVRLEYKLTNIDIKPQAHVYLLQFGIFNEGARTANLWSLEVILPYGCAIEHPGSLVQVKMNAQDLRFTHGVWEYSSERSPNGPRSILLPGQRLLLVAEMGYPQVLLKVTEESWRRLRTEDAPLLFRLYVDDCPMQEIKVPFADWCRY